MKSNGKSSLTGRKRRWWRWAMLVAFLACLFIFRREIKAILGIPVHRSYPAGDHWDSDGINPAFQFSPDGKTFAYIQHNTKYIYPAKYDYRPVALTDAVEVRWFPVDRQSAEKSIPLDFVDFGSEGRYLDRLAASVSFSPDCRHLAAISPNNIILIDLQSGKSRKICYEREHFGGMAWFSADEITFTTDADWAITFWRYRITARQEDRVAVYRHSQDSYASTNLNTEPLPAYLRQGGSAQDGSFVDFNDHTNMEMMDKFLNTEFGLITTLPPDLPTYSYPEFRPPYLRMDRWAPDGRSVVFTYRTEGQTMTMESFLNLESGLITPLPPAWYSKCIWRPDGSAVLVCDALHPDGNGILLIDARSGAVTDLSAEFKEAFGETLDIAFVRPRWTPDGKYVVLYNTEELPPLHDGGPTRSKQTGHVVQPDPFEVILSMEEYIIWSPLPGWLVLRNGDMCCWVNYAGTKGAKLNGWPPRWRWSPTGTHAADYWQWELSIVKVRPPVEEQAD